MPSHPSAPTARTGPVVDVGQLLDAGRWGGYQRWLIFLAALTIIFDGVDNQLLGLAIPSIMKDWGVLRAAFSPVLSLGYVGMMFGGAVSGAAGDRIGRRTALTASMVIFGVMTMGASFAHSIFVLAAFRMLAGFGLGGAMPNAAALAAEYVPVRQRPFAVTLTIVCVPLGAMLAGLIAERFLPTLGWRGLFGIGGAVPMVAAAAFFVLMPESPRFLVRFQARWGDLERTLRRMGRPVAPGSRFMESAGTSGDGSTGAPAVRGGSFGALFSREFRGDTLALWGSFFFSLMAVYLVFSWLPSMLTGAGLGRSASTGITAFNLGGVVGAILGGRSIARFGSRTPILLMAGGSVACALGMSAMAITGAASATPIIAMLALTGGLINATQTMMYALAAHVYPTAMRATGVGAAVAVGRIGATVSGYSGPWAIGYHGSASFFQLMGVAMLASAGCLALVRRHVKTSGAVI